MKKRTFALLIAVLLICATFLASCGNIEFTKPDDSTDSSGSNNNPSADNDHPAMDLINTDISQYIVLGSCDGLEITQNVAVGEDVIDEVLLNIAKNYGYYTELITDRATQEGDVLVIDFVGTMDGVAFDGGTAEGSTISLTESTGYIEGFDKDLYGIMPGTTVNTDVTFPDNYSETLAGKNATFAITVQGIIKTYGFTDKTVTEYTNGDYTTVEAFREYSKNSLIKANLEDFDDDVEEAIIKLIVDRSELKELPQAQIEYYYYANYNAAKNYYESNQVLFQYYYGITSFDQYLEALGMTESELTEDAKEEVKRDLVLVAYANSIGLTVSDSEYAAEFAELADLWGYDSSDELVEYLGDTYMRLYVLKDKAMEALRTSVKITTDYDQYSHLLEESTDTTAPSTDAAPSDTDTDTPNGTESN